MNVSAAMIKGTQSVKLCSNKILKFFLHWRC